MCLASPDKKGGNRTSAAHAGVTNWVRSLTSGMWTGSKIHRQCFNKEIHSVHNGHLFGRTRIATVQNSQYATRQVAEEWVAVSSVTFWMGTASGNLPKFEIRKWTSPISSWDSFSSWFVHKNYIMDFIQRIWSNYTICGGIWITKCRLQMTTITGTIQNGYCERT